MESQESAIDTLSIWVTIGQKLKDKRVARGISLQDVADYLKIGVRKVEAIEEGDLANLPELTFTKGFVRTYAKLLQLDLSDQLLQILPEVNLRSNVDRRIQPRKIATAYPSPVNVRFWRKFMLALIAIGVMLVLVFFFFRLKEDNSQIPIVEATSDSSNQDAPSAGKATDTSKPPERSVSEVTPVPKAEDASSHKKESKSELANSANPPTLDTSKLEAMIIAPQPAAKENKSTMENSGKDSAGKNINIKKTQIVIEVIDSSWLQVLNGAGKIVMDKTYQSGQKDEITVELPAQVVIGDVKAIRVFHQTKRLPLKSTHGVGFVEIKN